MFKINYFIPLLIFFLITFLLRQYSSYKGKKFIKYILTPLVTASITAIAILSVGQSGMTFYRFLVISALIISLIADTLLMIEEVDLIIFGIAFFMMAHLLYIIAFSLNYTFSFWKILPALIIIFIIRKLYFKFRENAGNMKLPVLIYMHVIAVMTYFAIIGISQGLNTHQVFVLIGAILFFASDTALAFDKFVKPIPYSTVVTWALYAPAQLFIALSCF